MAAITVVPFLQIQHNAKMSVLQQATINSKDDTRDIIILRKKVSMSKPKASSTPINNNTYITNNNVKRENENNNCDSRIKKKPPVLACRGGGGSVIRNSPLPTISVARRNARERNRVQQVNKGFETLRQHIPASVASAFTTTENTGRGGSKKLSKVETLRMAVEYIRSLQQILATDDPDGQVDDQSMASPLSLVSTSPAPSTVSHNPLGNYVDDVRHETSPGVINEEVNYDDGDSRDSFVNEVARYARLAPQRSFGFYKEVDYRDELDGSFVPVPLFPNSSSPFINLMGLRDQKDIEDKNLFGTYGLNYGVKQLTPIHHNPSASLSPGMYSEQSLSPADLDLPAAKPKFLPAFSKTLRPPLTSAAVNSVIQQTYHVMQQMPVKQEVKEEHVAGDGSVVDMDMRWWDGDERILTSPQ